MLLGIAAILWGISYIVAASCMNNDSFCNYEALITPFFLCMPALFLVALIMLFVSEQVFASWKRFAKWTIPISALILYLVPADTPSSWATGADLTKETASWGISLVFLLISLIIIVSKTVKLRSKNS